MVRQALAPLAVASALLLLAGCAGATATSDDGRVRIVASTDVYGDLATTIGGSAVQVTSVIDDPDRDPHEYEADARTQLELAKADVIVENGGGYDDFMDTMRKAARNADATVLNAVAISGHRATGGEELNEHVWYDYPTVKKVVQRLADAIIEEHPAAEAAVTRRADALESELDGLISAETAARARVAGAGVAITEPVPLYLLDALGAQNETPTGFSEAIEEDSDVPAAVLQDTLDLFREKRVKALVYNAQTGGPETDAVLAAAKRAGIPAVPVTETLPDGTHYVAWQKGILDETVAALASGS